METPLSSYRQDTPSSIIPSEMPTHGRICAVRVLMRYSEQQKKHGTRAPFMKNVLSNSQYVAQLTPQDRAFCEAVCLGVITTMPMLDEMLRIYCKRFSHAQYIVQAILRLCAYELLYMGHKDFVVVSQALLLAKQLAPRSQALIVALMHKLVQLELPQQIDARTRLRVALEKQPILEPATDSSSLLRDASRVCGIPLWMLREAYMSRGIAFAINFAYAHLTPRPLFVLYNPSSNELVERGELSHKFGMYLMSNQSAQKLHQKVAASKLIASDISAQLISLCVAYELKSSALSPRILEVGAGKGTKTLSILSLCTRLHTLPVCYVACDVSEDKLLQNETRVKRSGVALLPTYTHINNLPTHVPHTASFSCVFVDAPCAGLSTLRRHADTSIRISKKDISKSTPSSLPHIQLKILMDASAYVAQGGCLLYSTCSFSKAENEDVIDAFLATKEGSCFRRQAFLEPWMSQVDEILGRVYEYACKEDKKGKEDTKDHIAVDPHKLYSVNNDSTIVFSSYSYGPDAHVLTRLVRVA